MHEQGPTLIDRELYLPKSWTGDRERCRAAAVPDEVEFAIKATLAKDMLGRALDAGVPAAWVAADDAYGQDHKFRSWCERRRIGYVVAVPRSQSIPLSLGADLAADIAGLVGSRRADDLVARAPEQAWKRRSAGPGAKGERLYDWAVAGLHPPPDAPAGWGRWLLVRRQILTDTQLESSMEPELAYYLCAGPPGTRDDDLIRVAGARCAIEECFQTAKNEVGLDQYQVRRYDAWYRHITLAMVAHAYRSVTAAIAPKTRPQAHPAHPRRTPTSPGTSDPHPHPRPALDVVDLATPSPTPRPRKPLPTTKTDQLNEVRLEY